MSSGLATANFRNNLKVYILPRPNLKNDYMEHSKSERGVSLHLPSSLHPCYGLPGCWEPIAG